MDDIKAVAGGHVFPRRTFLRGTGVVSATVLLGSATPRLHAPAFASAMGGSSVSSQTGPLGVENKRMLAADTSLHARLAGADLRLSQASYVGKVIDIDEEWEREISAHDRGTGYVSTVMRDHEGRLRLYYELFHTSPPTRRRMGAVAFSDDGFTWEKPSLDLAADTHGVPESNLIHVGGAPLVDGVPLVSTPCVFLDEGAEPAERYKLIYWAEPDGGVRHGHTAVSADGLSFETVAQFTQASGGPLATVNHLDSVNLAFRDPQTGQYVIYTRENLTNEGDGVLASRGRGAMRTVSDDWAGPWPQRESVFGPLDFDETGLADIYTPGVFPYHGQYLALPAVWYRELGNNGPGPIYPTFLHSPDADTWHAPDYRHSLLDLGSHGTFDDPDGFGMVFPAPQLIDIGGELHIYYQYWNGQHHIPGGAGGRTASIHLATLRRDGFGAVTASGGAGGTWTTPVMGVPSNAEQLYVNVDARGGVVRAEALHADLDEPMPGLGVHHALPITGDHLEAEAWRGKRVNSVRNRDIRLRFHIRNASIYSFWFGTKFGGGRNA